MKDISCHILDIVQNSLHAGATRVVVSIHERSDDNRYELTITDNGSGIEEDMLELVTDPFYTTGKNKKVGLGIPLLKQNAEQAGGFFEIHSVKDGGTSVKAVFQLDHIDRLPEGDMGSTLRVLIAGNPLVDFIYRHCIDGREWDLDTSEINRELDPVAIDDPEVLNFLAESLENGVDGLRKKT